LARWALTVQVHAARPVLKWCYGIGYDQLFRGRKQTTVAVGLFLEAATHF